MQVETIDFDGDGLDDFLAMGYKEFFLYKNIGNAQFDKHSLIDSLYSFSRFSLFDWENDGDQDIFFTGQGNNGMPQIAWLENDGNQNFTYHFISGVIDDPYYVEAFDIDNDLDIDILVSSSSTDKLYWLQNDGLFNFTQSQIGSYVNQFQIADMNGDNDWDIIFGRAYTSTTISSVRCLENDGNNNFSMITLNNNFSIITEIIVDDINNDGYFDILVADRSDDKLVWLKNNSSYSFSTETNIMTNFDGVRGMALYDVNEDGKKDIIAGSQNDQEIYYFQGQGSTSSYSFSSGSLIYDELNYIYDIAIGNFDNQNHKDFVHIDYYDALLSVWTNDGNQSFTQDVLSVKFDSPRAFEMKDLDGDGDQDVAAASNVGDRIVWFENKGDDIFKEHELISNYEEPYVVRINDLDDDGDMDIISASSDDDRVTWWQNDGWGNFTMAHLSTSVNDPRDIWIEDYDGDGDKDVAVICFWLYTQSGNTGAQWLENDGSENFTLHEIEEDVRAGRSMRGADMNGDSLVDIVISSYYYTSSTLKIASNTGNGFGIEHIDNVLCEDFEVCDFDGDQDIDILAVDDYLDSLYFYENLGNWQFTKHTLAYEYRLFGIDTVDFDNDNDIDIVYCTGYSGFTNSSIYEYGIFRNDGAGSLSKEVWNQNLSMITPIEVVDYENDGDFDVMLGFAYADKIVLSKNLEVNCPFTISISGITDFCEGGTVQIEAFSSDTTIHYQWYKDNQVLLNDTLNTLFVDSSGIYSVEASDSTCSIFSNSLNVVEHQSYSTEEYISLCQGESIQIDTITISSAGDYLINSSSQFGCDSTVLLHVSISPIFQTQIDAEICDGETFDFNGNLLSMAGNYYDTLQSIFACDSIVQLDLTVNPIENTNISAEICDGQTFNFIGTLLTQAGNYSDTLQSIFACDSIVQLDLTVNPIENTNIFAEICDGETFDFNGNLLSLAGNYSDTLQSIFACDSIIQLDLTVNPIENTNISAEICDGQTFNFNGNLLSVAGNYYDTLQSIFACDSIFQLDLTVNPIENTNISAEICDGQTFDFNGNLLSMAGNYYDTLQSIFACDSIVQLDLTVNPIENTNISAQICDGETFDFNGNLLTQAGNYNDTMQSIYACDSIINLELTVNLIDSIFDFASICEGEEIEFNGQFLSQSGIYYQAEININGCDSIIVLDLSVLPLPQINLGNDTTINTNETLLIDAGLGFSQYLWQDGSSAQTFLVDGAILGEGTFDFSVEVEDINLCINSDTIVVSITISSGIVDFTATKVKIYPNPVNNRLCIENLSHETILDIYLYDISGKLILNKKLSGKLNTIDMSNFSPGDYYLKLIHKNESKVVPIIKGRNN